jgi:hypothetical protein
MDVSLLNLLIAYDKYLLHLRRKKQAKSETIKASLAVADFKQKNEEKMNSKEKENNQPTRSILKSSNKSKINEKETLSASAEIKAAASKQLNEINEEPTRRMRFFFYLIRFRIFKIG